MAATLGGTALSLLVCVAIAGCETRYSEPPTRCDDWCLATQRANCPEDEPHGCVGSCEFFGPRNYPECVPAWDALLACYEDAPDTMFYCSGELSRAREGLCEAETSAYGRCTHPVWQSCVEGCEAFGRACEGFDESLCTYGCASMPQECLEAVPYFDCLIADASSCDLTACAADRVPLDRCISAQAAQAY